MSTSAVDAHRDSQGRVPNAPAWAGDITTLPDQLLHDRIEALGSHIGRLSTTYHLDGRWTLTPGPEFTRKARPWIVRRLECLRESDHRAAATAERVS